MNKKGKEMIENLHLTFEMIEQEIERENLTDEEVRKILTTLGVNSYNKVFDAYSQLVKILSSK